MNDPVHNQLKETNKTLPLSNKTQLMISMNFKRFASLVMFFIFLALLRFVLEHNTIQTKRVLALFEFCYPTQPGNLTERENLRHVPFLFSLRIFVSAFSARTFFQFFPCYLPARLFRNFTFNRRKKVKERSPKRSDKVQFGRWRDSFSSALYALYSDRARSSNQLQRTLYPNFNTKISNETKPELEDLSPIVNICLL